MRECSGCARVRLTGYDGGRRALTRPGRPLVLPRGSAPVKFRASIGGTPQPAVVLYLGADSAHLA